jgi:site-specific DNA-adenine methylase
MYQAVAAGWEPPETVSEEEYKVAKGLPDSDPRKAFCGFGSSFGGKHFGGYAGVYTAYRANGKTENRNTQKATRKSLRDKRASLAAVSLACVSFLSVVPEPGVEALYCDPPYEGTTGYKGHDAFDHTLFWTLCQQWADLGTRVFVSEYSCPVPHELAWSKHLTVTVSNDKATRALKEEKLFLVKGKNS